MQVCFTLSQKRRHFRPEFIQNAKRGSICFPPQQARRSTDYELRFEHRHLCETWRMLKLLFQLHSGMLPSPLPIPTPPPYGKTCPFQRWQQPQCGWMYQSMRRGWLYACGTEVFREILIKVPFFYQGSPILPLWQCWTTNRVQSRFGKMWNILP